MTHGARTTEEIYTSLRDSLTGKIQTLTNFTNNSFNAVWTNAVAERFRESEVKLTVAQFSGWVDYAGGPISNEELEELGIRDDLDPEDVEPFIDDEHIDELVKIVGVERDPGVKASGTVTFRTQSAPTTIPESTAVGTQPDSVGNFNKYETTEEVETISGETTVSAPVEGVEVGQEFNTGAGTVTFLPSPPGGVLSVTNAAAIDGGEDRESNDDLRERAKGAVFRSSGGGTAQGMIGFIESETGASQVKIVEYPTGDSIRSYPHGHVIAVGGTDQDVLDAIEESRPVSVEHILQRPKTATLNIDVTVAGEAGTVDFSEIEDGIVDFLADLGLDEDLFEDKLIFTIIQTDEDVNDVGTFDYTISDDAFFFDSSQNIYEMQLGEEMLDDGITSVDGTLNGNSNTFTEDTDYQEIDNTGDATDDSIDWSIGRTTTTTTISYTSGQTEYDIESIDGIDNFIHNGISSVTNTTTSTTLTEDTDWEEADTTGDNLQNGIRFLNAQNDGDSIDITYDYGDLPDVVVNQTFSETFDEDTLKYRVDSAMIDGGIVEVTGTLNGTSNTFVKGVDFEEWDADGDGKPEGIDWGIGGAQPDNNTVFTVTYDGGTTFVVDYDIREGDIVIGPGEKIDPGDVNVSEI